MELILVILAAVVVYVLIQQQNMKSRLETLMDHFFKLAGDRDALQQQVNELSNTIEALKTQGVQPTNSEVVEAPEIIEETLPTPPSEEAVITIPPIIEPEPEIETVTTPVLEPEIVEENTLTESSPVTAFSAPKTTENEASPRAYSPPQPEEPSAFSLLLKKWERQFADNWTGILGTAIMVLGVGYLSIYTALKVSPLFRVMIIWAYAGLLMGSYLILKKKPLWEKTGLWLRSAGASLFLFGCFGASQIQALRFIEPIALSYGLIILGIGLNLWIGYRIKKQTFLSLHVVLSLLILCVIPEKLLLTFLIASGTATVGILLSYKEKWEYHIVTVISAFLLFDIWFTAEGTKLTAFENKIAILGIVMVAVSCIAMQYRKLYDQITFDKAGFITHLVNWGLFAVGLLLHATGSKFKTIVLVVGAIACFWASRIAKKRGIQWLYQVDFMVSFVLLSFTIITLNEWNVGVALVFIGLTIVFNAGLLLTFLEEQPLLHRILKIGYSIYAVLTLIISLRVVIATPDYGLWMYGLLGHSVLALGLHVYSLGNAKWNGFDTFLGLASISFNGFFAIGLQLVMVALVFHHTTDNAFIYALLGPALLWSVLYTFRDSLLLNLGRLFFFVLAGIEVIYLSYEGAESWNDLIRLFAISMVIGLQLRKPVLLENRFIIRFTMGLVGTILSIVLNFKYGDYQPVLSTLVFFGLAVAAIRIMIHLARVEPTNLELPKFFKVLYGILFLSLLYFIVYHYDDLTALEMILCYGIGLSLPVLNLAQMHRLGMNNPELDAFIVSKKMDSVALFLITQCIGFWGISEVSSSYAIVYFGAVPLLYLMGYSKSAWFEKLGFFAFLQLVFNLIYSLPVLLEFTGAYDTSQTVYFVIGFVLTVGYSVFQYRTTRSDAAEYLVKSVYIQNLFLLFLVYQSVVELYFGLALLGIALVNYAIRYRLEIGIHRYTPDAFALMGLVTSLSYSINASHQFSLLQWSVFGGILVGAIAWMLLMHKTAQNPLVIGLRQISVNLWLSILVFSQLDQKWMPFYWAMMAIVHLYLYSRNYTFHRAVPLLYYGLANLHLGILGYWYYQPSYLPFYIALMVGLGVFVGLAYKWLPSFSLKNSLLIYPVTLSIGLFLYLTFDKGALTFFWVLEALGLLVLSITLKEKYFRYVSLSVVGLCIVRLMFFDLSNADFLLRALVLLGVGIVLLVMNSLFKKYKDRLD
ncbi:MAG: hypothetical protein RLZZ500_484 [Bacteroidota bacterium]|jgi:hypothetical protein